MGNLELDIINALGSVGTPDGVLAGRAYSDEKAMGLLPGDSPALAGRGIAHIGCGAVGLATGCPGLVAGLKREQQ